MEARQSENILRSGLVVSAVLFLLVAGLIHLLIGPTHWAHAPAHGLFFAIAGLAELVWAVAFWRRPSIRLVQLGTVLASGLIALWAITRLVPAPFTGAPEAVDTYGLLCKLAEGLAVGALVALSLHRPGFGSQRRAGWGGIAPWLILGAAGGLLTYQVAIAAEPVFPGLTATGGMHSHGRDTLSHGHGEAQVPAETDTQERAEDSHEHESAPVPEGTQTPEQAELNQAHEATQGQNDREKPSRLPTASSPGGEAPTGEGLRQNTPPAAAGSPRPVTFQGSGEQSTETFELRPGLAEFHYEHPADTPFAIFLLDTEGYHLAMLANATTAVTGAQVFGITEAGLYRLHVIAKDDWTARVSQPAAADLEARATGIIPLRGDRPSVAEPMRLKVGPLRVAWRHQGALGFEVVLWGAGGVRAVGIVSANGKTEGEKTIMVPADGVYVLNVLADGPWTLSLTARE